MKEFKVNRFITLKLESTITIIYIKNDRFVQCKFLLINIPKNEEIYFDDIKSIDEVAKLLNNSMENEIKYLKIPPEIEFWGHCSNLQVWCENNYTTYILRRNQITL